MTAVEEEAALLLAIRAEPLEDTPRLVYADWLQEQGDEARAEFIRVQCELATIEPKRPRAVPMTPKNEAFWQHREEVRTRQRELWHALPTARVFAPNSPGIAIDPDTTRFWLRDQDGPMLVVSRGFVSEVRCTAAAFLGECTLCDGERYIDLGVMGGYPTPEVTNRVICSACHGTGRTEGLAKALFVAHPITRVVLTDREPQQYSTRPREFYWTRLNADLIPLDTAGVPQLLPAVIWDRLTGHNDTPDARVFAKRYATRDLALDALSAACVAHGRRLAGLPPLLPPPQE